GPAHRPRRPAPARARRGRRAWPRTARRAWPGASVEPDVVEFEPHFAPRLAASEYAHLQHVVAGPLRPRAFAAPRRQSFQPGERDLHGPPLRSDVEFAGPARVGEAAEFEPHVAPAADFHAQAA